jgi:hypothetical protein
MRYLEGSEYTASIPSNDLLPLLAKTPLQLLFIIAMSWVLYTSEYWFKSPLSYPIMSVLRIYLPILVFYYP